MSFLKLLPTIVFLNCFSLFLISCNKTSDQTENPSTISKDQIKGSWFLSGFGGVQVKMEKSHEYQNLSTAEGNGEHLELLITDAEFTLLKSDYRGIIEKKTFKIYLPDSGIVLEMGAFTLGDYEIISINSNALSIRHVKNLDFPNEVSPDIAFERAKDETTLLSRKKPAAQSILVTYDSNNEPHHLFGQSEFRSNTSGKNLFCGFIKATASSSKSLSVQYFDLSDEKEDVLTRLDGKADSVFVYLPNLVFDMKKNVETLHIETTAIDATPIFGISNKSSREKIMGSSKANCSFDVNRSQLSLKITGSCSENFDESKNKVNFDISCELERKNL